MTWENSFHLSWRGPRTRPELSPFSIYLGACFSASSPRVSYSSGGGVIAMVVPFETDFEAQMVEEVYAVERQPIKSEVNQNVNRGEGLLPK